MSHLDNQKEVLRITQERYKASLVSGLDVAQANTVYGSTLASLPSIRTSIASSINAIALLLGRFPAEVDSLLSRPAPVPVYSHIVSTAVPAELLRRRPDIISAERTLAAQGCRSRSGTKGVYANAVDSRLIWSGGTRSRQSLSEAQHHLFGGADFEAGLFSTDSVAGQPFRKPAPNLR